MSTILLYFGDVFWCTVPYNGLALYYELSKNHNVIPVFMRNDIRIHKKWRGNERFYFDVSEFGKIPYVETDDLLGTYITTGAELCIMPCQMQFKENFARRNRAMKDAGAKLCFWDCGGADSMWCHTDETGWSYFFSKGSSWKKYMVDSTSISHFHSKQLNASETSIFSCGALDFDELFLESDAQVRIPILSKEEFCNKYNLDQNRPIVAYIPANPRPDNNFKYPSGITARDGLRDINRSLISLMERGYQICFKTHPGDYIATEILGEYYGLHPRAHLGGYKSPRYECDGFNQFSTINAEDGYNLYRNCDFGVTNYSHTGYELMLAGKPVISYRMKECVEWHFIDNLCDLTYTDVQTGQELIDVVINNKFKTVPDSNKILSFFSNINGSTYKSISGCVNEILNDKKVLE